MMKPLTCSQLTGRSQWIKIIRQSSTSLRVELDPAVQEKLERNECHPKQHPGAQRNLKVELPEDLKTAMFRTIGDVPKKILLTGAVEFTKYLHSRKPPLEPEEKQQIVQNVKQEVTDKLNVQWDKITDEYRTYYNKVIASKTEQIAKQRTYNWRQIDFTRHMGLQYMVARSAQEYAVNFHVLRELQSRFQYTPQTVFDFGSGVGTVLWAVDTLWSRSLKEVFAVDSSPHMNQIAGEMLAHSERKALKKVLFQRQFLPSSSNLNYDLVVSSFSLLELPSQKSRLETLLNLWRRTKDYLVLIEAGTMAGFQVISEARDFILWNMRRKLTDSSQLGHVVSPCPHDFKCPMRSDTDRRPCNFSSAFTTYPQVPVVKKELYSYVIFKKGLRPTQEPEWPRVVRPILVRHRHAICRLCTSEGKLSEVIFTPTKHGKLAHRCARQSKWGDRLPISIEELQKIEDNAECRETQVFERTNEYSKSYDNDQSEDPAR